MLTSVRELGVYIFLALLLVVPGRESKAAQSAHKTVTLSTQRTQVLLKSTNLLDELARRPQDPIPPAVFNRTRCLAIVPAQTAKAPELKGVASCRTGENAWTDPVLITFRPQKRAARRNETQDLLIFILDESAQRALFSSGFSLGKRVVSAAGPVPRQKSLATNADFSSESLTYVRKRNVVLGGSTVGTIHVEKGQGASVTRNRTTAGTIRNLKDPEDRFANSISSFFNTITPVGIIIHHSGVIPSDHKVPANRQQVDVYHMERGFETICAGKVYHVAYHYLILPDGKIQSGRPEHCQGAHALGYNAYLGISLLGDFSSVDNPTGKKGFTRPTPQQMRSLLALCMRLSQFYKIPAQRILRHSDVAQTQCPGDRFPFQAFLNQLEQTSHKRASHSRS